MDDIRQGKARRAPAGLAVLISIALTAGGAVLAQSGRNLERPGHWTARYDDGAGAAERRFVVMRPGWHIFAGPGGLLWDSGRFASGNYSVSSTVYLFPVGDPDQSGSTRLDSAYGLFLGGRDLDGETAAYLSFVIGNDRRFRVASHGGSDTAQLVPWTDHEAIAAFGETTTGGPVENVLAIDVRDDAVIFYVNDAVVAELPRDGLPLDGVIGLRAGAGLSLHVTEIAIGPNRRTG